MKNLKFFYFSFKSFWKFLFDNSVVVICLDSFLNYGVMWYFFVIYVIDFCVFFIYFFEVICIFKLILIGFVILC